MVCFFPLMSFRTRKLLNLMKLKLSIFFYSLWFVYLRSQRFSSMLSSRNFIVRATTTGSVIHLGLIFLLGNMNWSSCLHIHVQLFQHYLLKRLSFYHWVTWASLFKISWSCMLVFLVNPLFFIDLHVYPYYCNFLWNLETGILGLHLILQNCSEYYRCRYSAFWCKF